MKCYFKEKTTIIPFSAVNGVVAKMGDTINHKKNGVGGKELEGYIIFIHGGNIAFTIEVGERFNKDYLEWLDWHDKKEQVAASVIMGIGEIPDDVGEMRFKALEDPESAEKINDLHIKDPLNVKVEKDQIIPKEPSSTH